MSKLSTSDIKAIRQVSQTVNAGGEKSNKGIRGLLAFIAGSTALYLIMSNLNII